MAYYRPERPSTEPMTGGSDAASGASGYDGARTMQGVVVARLRQEILSGELPYGTRLTQAEVAARFDISTTPVREAFRELATLGLVRVLPHKGAIVTQPSSEDLNQIYQVRVLLEPVCTAWSAQHIDEEALERAAAVLRELEHAAPHNEAAGINRAFHTIIAQGCGNAYLSEIVVNLLDLSTPYFALIYKSHPERFSQQAAEHHEILAACRARDSERAYAASLRHLSALKMTDPAGTPGTMFGSNWLPAQLRDPSNGAHHQGDGAHYQDDGVRRAADVTSDREN